jgi:hypothetical protein
MAQHLGVRALVNKSGANSQTMQQHDCFPLRARVNKSSAHLQTLQRHNCFPVRACTRARRCDHLHFVRKPCCNAVSKRCDSPMLTRAFTELATTHQSRACACRRAGWQGTLGLMLLLRGSGGSAVCVCGGGYALAMRLDAAVHSWVNDIAVCV